jgi:hypothetical protein
MDTPLPQMPLHASSPVARLPFETLAELFERAILLDQNKFSSCDVQLRRLVSVCRHWRTVAMAYPRLWSALVFTSVEVTASMLRRSKECSLVVKADCSPPSNSKQPVIQAILLALSNLCRVCVLHIEVSTDLYGGLAAMMDRADPAPDLNEYL